MPTRRNARLPAAAPALAFVSGLLAAHLASVPVTLAVLLALPFVVRGTRGRRMLALLALAAFLAGAHLGTDRQARRRTAWLPGDGASVERSFRGIVLRAPERDDRGTTSLLVRGAPAESGQDPATAMRLRVAPSSRSATAPLDRLRRGDRIEAWCRARLPPARRPPSNEDPRAMLRAQGIDAIGGVKNARLLTRLERGRVSPLRFLDEVRVEALRRLDGVLPAGGPDRAVLGAMLLGERGGLDPRDLAALRDSGLLHVLAISGVNVTLAAALMLFLLRRLRLGPTALLAVATSGLAAFCFVVGAAPSVLRAVLAAGVALLGRRIGREGNAANTLAVVALLLAAIRPAIVRDPGFQLSFLATAGIVLLADPIARALPLPRFLGVALGASLGAYLTTAPLTAWTFCRVSPVALVSNLVAAPLAAASLLLGFLALMLAPAPGIGAAAAGLAVATVRCLLAVARIAASVPGGTLRVAAPSIPELLVYFALLALAAGWVPLAGVEARRASRLMFALALVRLHAGSLPGSGAGPGAAFVLDVGQGQAVALRAAPGRFVLVDAGGTAGGRFDHGDRVVAPFLAAEGCRRIEALVLTHDHDDHAGGAASILRDFEVGALWFGAGAMRDRATHDLVAQAVARGTAVVLAERGVLARRAGLSLEVLHPSREDTRLAINDRCVVLRASFRADRILIPGDLELEGERRLLARRDPVAAEAIVVGHHGASRSTSPVFLSAVSPRLAIISAGRENRFGHPAPATIERLRRSGARVLRTDRWGSIELRASGSGWDAEPLSDLEQARYEGDDEDQKQ